MNSYLVRWGHGATESAETYDDALAIVHAVLSEPVIGHSGDITDGGLRTLFWADDRLAQNDDGSRAAGAIVDVLFREGAL